MFILYKWFVGEVGEVARIFFNEVDYFLVGI